MTRLPTNRWVAAVVLSIAVLSHTSRVDAKVVVSDDGMYTVDIDASARMITGTSHATAPPDAASAPYVGQEVADLIAASLPAGARVVPVSSRIGWGQNVPVVRTTLEVEAGDGKSVREVLTAVGGRTLYITVWSGTREQAAELARLADQAAKTTDLRPEGRPFRPLNPWPGRLLFLFGVGGLILLRVRMKKKSATKR
jgi:hypothetical protein